MEVDHEMKDFKDIDNNVNEPDLEEILKHSNQDQKQML